MSLIRGVIAGAFNKLGISADCVHDITLALSEACTNVVDHADPADEYEVRLQVDDDQCAISVTNTGAGFVATSLRGIPADVSSERGRGVSIMDAVRDRVDFISEPETGSIVHLVKTLDLLSDEPMARPRPAKLTERNPRLAPNDPPRERVERQVGTLPTTAAAICRKRTSRRERVPVA